MKRTITIVCDDEDIHDGDHSLKELYAHRCHLLVCLMRSHPDISWRAKRHYNAGLDNDKWFLAGMELPTGQISYHLPIWMWTWLDGSGVGTYEQAQCWDGHTSLDVLERLHSWCKDMFGESCWPVKNIGGGA